MTLTDLVKQGAALAEAAGVPVPLALIHQLMELARPELVIVEAPVVTVEIDPAVPAPMGPCPHQHSDWCMCSHCLDTHDDSAGAVDLARHEGGDA